MKLRFRNLRVLLALCLPGCAFAQTIASFSPASPFIAALPTTLTLSGQTFTAEISATVGVVTVLAQTLGGPGPATVTFQLRSVSGGLPTAAILAAVTRPGTTLTGSLSAFSVDFSSQGIFLNSGESYALTLFGSSMFGLGGAADGYAGGAQVIGGTSSLRFFAPSRDLAFSVTAAPAVAVPEPSTFAAMGVVALVGICAWSRRRQRKV